MKHHLVYTTIFLIASASGYDIPNPSIKIFHPRGFSVSIPDSEGITALLINANINKSLQKKEAGDIIGELQKQEGSWTYHNSNVKVRQGDKIYYWIFVQKGDFSYLRGVDEYEVTDIVRSEQSNNPTTRQAETSICHKVLVNLTQALIDLQREVNSVRETNLILSDIIGEHYDISTTLTLEGPRMRDDELETTVQDIINKKLRLQLKVRNVTRSDNGKIQFQVLTLDDKVAVMKAAKEKLKGSNFIISH